MNELNRRDLFMCVPESNTPDTRAVHPNPPTGDTKRHHVFCDCELCRVDYEKNPQLRPDPEWLDIPEFLRRGG